MSWAHWYCLIDTTFYLLTEEYFILCAMTLQPMHIFFYIFFVFLFKSLILHTMHSNIRWCVQSCVLFLFNVIFNYFQCCEQFLFTWRLRSILWYCVQWHYSQYIFYFTFENCTNLFCSNFVDFAQSSKTFQGILRHCSLSSYLTFILLKISPWIQLIVHLMH